MHSTRFSLSLQDSKLVTLSHPPAGSSEGNGVQGEKGELFTLRWAQTAPGSSGSCEVAFERAKNSHQLKAGFFPRFSFSSQKGMRLR